MTNKLYKKTMFFMTSLSFMFTLTYSHSATVEADSLECQKLKEKIKTLNPIRTKDFSEGLPKADQHSLDFIKLTFNFDLSEQAAALLMNLYLYEMPRDMDVFCPVNLRGEDVNELFEQIEDAHNKRGVDRTVLPFAKENDQYWCLLQDDDDMKIALYSLGLHGDISQQLEGPYAIKKWIKDLLEEV